jgi:hypothetical protein
MRRKASGPQPPKAHSERVAGSEPRETEIAGRLTDAVICARCGSSSGLDWRGWLAYRVEERGGATPPELGFYCPTCAGAKKAGR